MSSFEARLARRLRRSLCAAFHEPTDLAEMPLEKKADIVSSPLRQSRRHLWQQCKKQPLPPNGHLSSRYSENTAQNHFYLSTPRKVWGWQSWCLAIRGQNQSVSRLKSIAVWQHWSTATDWRRRIRSQRCQKRSEARLGWTLQNKWTWTQCKLDAEKHKLQQLNTQEESSAYGR